MRFCGNRPRLLLIGLAIVTTCLSGCATVRSKPLPCVPVVEYDQAFLDRASGELNLLPEGSAIENMLADYVVMRDQARACVK